MQFPLKLVIIINERVPIMSKHRQRRGLASAVLTAGAALVVAACGSTATNPSSSSAQSSGGAAKAASGAPIKIGAILDLTGAGSTLGVSAQRGLQLEMQELNAKGGVGGHPLQLDIVDGQSSPSAAVAAARSMLQTGHPAAVIGPNLAAECYAVAPVLAAANVVQYCQSGAPVLRQDPLYFSALSHFVPWLGDMPMNWAVKNGYTRIGILTTNDTTGQLSREVLLPTAKAAGLTVVDSEEYATDAVDVTPQVTRLAAAKPQAIIMGVSGQPAVVALRGLAQLGLSVPVWTLGANSSVAFAQLVKGTLPKGGLYTNGEDVEVPDEVAGSYASKANAVAYVTAYRKKYGTSPDIFGASAADALQILAKAQAAVGANGPAIAQYIEHLSFVGILYPYHFSVNDHRGAPLSGLVVRFTDTGSLAFVAQYHHPKLYLTALPTSGS